MSSQLTLFATTVWLLISLNICSAQNTYHVSSATDPDCPSTPCLNFSQYVQYFETYFTSNTTFIFRPGDHIVEKNVVIANVSALKLIGSNSVGTTAQILCSSPAGFEFKNVSHAEIIALEFISCGMEDIPFSAIFLHLTNNFELTNCTFLSSRNTALLTVSSTVLLTGNNFTNNSAGQYGGGIWAISSYLYLQGENTFAHNLAQKAGGAMAITYLSTLNSTRNTVFMNNVAAVGGGISVILSTATFMGDSYFVGNVAVLGSTIYIENGSSLFSANQTFHKNSAHTTGGIFLRYAQIDTHGQNDILSMHVNNTCISPGGIGRAVGAGPAGPAAAGPIFGQLTRAKMPYEVWWAVELLLQK